MYGTEPGGAEQYIVWMVQSLVGLYSEQYGTELGGAGQYSVQYGTWPGGAVQCTI
jgi:hypothetical protein